jgi:hypothetical protein
MLLLIALTILRPDAVRRSGVKSGTWETSIGKRSKKGLAEIIQLLRGRSGIGTNRIAMQGCTRGLRGAPSHCSGR